ncbi:tetratricopeptide repeat protein [Limisalsivibrio acetivorans]|uniref:tetratricopeptide repeat protein n=1 Tax=Limisalsivibrio acetivorans TaxID=1304888 RepID=UPI0003B36292|nr:tetratricopeptide repeat protein [Limisalsivibrio acetivorans]
MSIIRYGLIVLLIPVHIWLTQASVELTGGDIERGAHGMSGKLISLLSLDFRGLAADSKMLDAVFYVGGKIGRKETLTESDWDYYGHLINASLEIDPYFFDVYYFASSMLAWEAKRYEEAVAVLEKGAEKLPSNKRILFNLGFIHYYFLGNNLEAAKYIGEAAKLPGAPPHYATLASRLAYDSGSHQMAMGMISEMLDRTSNESVRRYYMKRLTALDRAVTLEKKAHIYRERNGSFPERLLELKKAGLIDEIPADPYGGEYYINDRGRVYSTSKFVD